MVKTICRTIAAGVFAWFLTPGAQIQAQQNDEGQQGKAYQQDSSYKSSSTTTQTQTSTRRGSTDSTRMEMGKMKHKSVKEGSMKSTPHSKKVKKHMKSMDNSSMSDSSATHRRGTLHDSSSIRHRGTIGDSSSWKDRNRPDYPSGTSGGNVTPLDSTHRRGTLGDSTEFNDRNNSATMDTVMGGSSDSNRVHRRGEDLDQNWNTADSSMHRQWSRDSGNVHRRGSDMFDSTTRTTDSTMRRGGSLDSANRNDTWQSDSSSRRGGIYHRGGISDSAGSPEMNNPDINRSNPELNRPHDVLRDSSRLAPPELREKDESDHHSTGSTGAYQYQHSDSGSQSSGSKSGTMGGSTRRGGSMENMSSEFAGTFKAVLMDSEIKARKGEATVKVTVSGLKIVDPAEMKEKPHRGEGHIHYQIDDGPEIATTATKLSFHKLSAGDHTIKVMLSGNDHNPLGPQETLKVTIPNHGQE